MRIVSASIIAGVLGLTSVAFADAGIGCGDDTTVEPNHDMSAPQHDLAAPHDLSTPRDARRDRRRRRGAAGAGLVVLSGLGASCVAVARRKVRT